MLLSLIWIACLLSANLHLRSLNPHIEVDGWEVQMPVVEASKNRASSGGGGIKLVKPKPKPAPSSDAVAREESEGAPQGGATRPGERH